jgi:TP53 regulating kinase-like protein
MLQDRSSWVMTKRGAEASLWKMTLFGKACIAKYAEPKSWRVQALDDKLRSDRLQSEARSNLRCIRLGIPVAPILFVDRSLGIIVMEELTGPTIKQLLFDGTDPTIREVVRQLGVLIAKLHENDIIHSDLTTSNFMLHNGTVHAIDFGLSYISTNVEDRAVDIYVLERAFRSSHPGKEDLLDVVLAAYFATVPKCDAIQTRLKKVRSRGRKRSMVG